MTEFFQKLMKLGLCEKCGFRYLGVRDPSPYQIDLQSNSEIIVKSFKGDIKLNSGDEEPAAKLVKRNVCITCLGLLQALTQDESIDQICNQVLAEKYDSPYIACAVSLPIAMQIRAHSLALFLQTQETTFNPYQVVPMKEAWKWSCSNRIASGLNKESTSGAACAFLVNIPVDYEDDDSECQPLQEIHSDDFDTRRRENRKFRGQLFTRQSVEALLGKTSLEQFQKVYDSPPLPPNSAVKYGKVSCTQEAIFIAGRYQKFSRELCQTPWVVEGERRLQGSVQELISTSLESFVGSKSSKFLSSGREDVDVRTLGKGRPFAVELADPRHTDLKEQDLKCLQLQINNGSKNLIAVRDLQVVNKEELSLLKEGEEQKRKNYEALCVCLNGITEEKLEILNATKDLVLKQKTPIRVLHRRPLATRDKTIFEMSTTYIDKNHFRMNVWTQAGTYVKEFVHGDFGRTSPNIGELLGTPVDILALDVKEIELDWPKSIDT